MNFATNHSLPERPMNVHKNAKLTPLGREQVVKRKAAGETSAAIATALGVSTATVCK
jgi:hypothetical protein